MNESPSIKRCLVADDVRASRELISRLLAERDIVCTCVADGKLAMDEVSRGIYSFVISDIEMPNVNGLELLSFIRRHDDPSINKMPVVMISSLQDKKMVEVVRRFGANGVLGKPLDRSIFESFLNAVRQGAQWFDGYSDGLDDRQNLILVSPKLRRIATELSGEPD